MGDPNVIDDAWVRFRNADLSLDGLGEVLLDNGFTPRAVRDTLSKEVGFIPPNYFGTEDFLDCSKKHIEQIRRKANEADDLNPFWRGVLLSALDCTDAHRRRADSYAVALTMIREGCADPRGFAGNCLKKREGAA